MSKSMFSGLTVAVLMMLLSNQALAYTKLTVLSGQVLVVSSQVLGDDENKNEEEKKEPEKQEVKEVERKEVKNEERRDEVKQVEIKREDVKVRVEPGERSKVEIIKKNKANEEAKKLIEKKREELKTKLEQGNKDGEITEKERELLKTAIDKQGEKLQKLQEKPTETVEDRSVGIDLGEQRMRSEGGETRLNDEGVEVRTQLPLTIEPEDKSVSVDTQDEREVEVERPRVIMDELKKQNVLDELNVDSANLPESSLTLDGGEPVYDLHGTKSEKLFGFVPVKIEKNLQVDVNGKVINTRQSFISSFLDFLSI